MKRKGGTKSKTPTSTLANKNLAQQTKHYWDTSWIYYQRVDTGMTFSEANKKLGGALEKLGPQRGATKRIIELHTKLIFGVRPCKPAKAKTRKTKAQLQAELLNPNPNLSPGGVLLQLTPRTPVILS